MAQSDQPSTELVPLAMGITQAAGRAEDFDDGLGPASDDGLLDVIFDIETKLEALRDTHRQQHRLEVELLEQDLEIQEREQTLTTREQTLAQVQSTLEQRAEEVGNEQALLVRERAMLDQRLAALEDRFASLDEQQRDQEALGDEVLAERDELARTKAEIQSQHQELAARDLALAAQTSELDSERQTIEQDQTALENDRAELNKRAQVQQDEARALEALRVELAQREQELAEKAQAHESMRTDFAALSAQLEAIRAEASVQTAPETGDKVSSEERAKQLEQRVKAIEEERRRMEVELARTRRDMGQSVAHAMPSLAQHAEMTARSAARTKRRTAVLAAIWIVTVAVAARAVVLGIGGAMPALAAGVLGVVFAASFFSVHAVAGRLLDPMALPVGLFGATFGLWFPRWVASIETALVTWELPAGFVPASVVSNLPLGIATGTTALAMSFALFLLTGSGRLFGQTLFAAIVTTGLILMPDESQFGIGAAVVLWHAMVAAALGHWALAARSRGIPMLSNRLVGPGSSRPL